jgi:hypothetical protein
VRIHDIRTAASDIALEREGFEIAAFDDRGVDNDDPDALERVWLPSVKELLKARTGAADIVTWAMGGRFSTKLPQSRRTVVSAPARLVHTDFSPGPLGARIDNQDVDVLIAKRTGESAPRRWRFFNVWQAISPAPHDYALALCDMSSTIGDDFVNAWGKSTYENGLEVAFEVSWVKYRPEQRWAYVADLRQDEVLIFSGLDRTAVPACRRVPHSAFENPLCPPDAPPRRSIEVRALAIF